MAIAAKYATIAGDRVHPSSLLRSLPNSEDGGQADGEQVTTEGENVNLKPPLFSPSEPSLSKTDATPPDSPPPAYQNENEDRTLLDSL